ncbi:MAG TPA: hypothetical protein VGN60_03560 [Devosia sp.]|jgi:hypothetical protein|nr:hypothetical protein [Devosia sp.]
MSDVRRFVAYTALVAALIVGFVVTAYGQDQAPTALSLPPMAGLTTLG